MSAEEPTSRPVDPRRIGALEILTLTLGLAVFGLFVTVVTLRIVFPVQAEWMTGSILDAVERVRDGQPIYVAPAASFIPFLYPPLYYWLAGALAHVTSAFVACKIVSLAATATTAWSIWSACRSLGTPRLFAVLAVFAFFAAYANTLFFYDLERVDILGTAIVALALALLLRSKEARFGAALDVTSGVLFGLAFFAKQPGLLAFAAVGAALLVSREWRRALRVIAPGALVFVALFAWLQISTHGWFRYYCLALPQSHGIVPALLSTFFVEDAPPLFALFLASVAVLVPQVPALVRTLKTRRPDPALGDWTNVAFSFVLFAGLLGGYLLRTHRGGWENVILAWTPLGAMATGVAASRATDLASGTKAFGAVRAMVLGGFCLQFLAGAYDPNESAPGRDELREASEFTELVREVEEQGEVVVTPMSHVSRIPHFHAAALYDVLRAGDPAPADYLQGLRERRYAGLFTGAPREFLCDRPSCEEVTRLTMENYFVASRLRPFSSYGVAGFDARPRWILRPRKTPLSGMTMDALERRQALEMGYAEKLFAHTPKEKLTAPDDRIEGWAAGDDGARPTGP